MIRGRVKRIDTKLEARIAIDIADMNGLEPQSAEVTVDTGASVHLMLPRETIQRLGLTFFRQQPMEFANDSIQAINVYIAAVSWHEENLTVPVFESNHQSLPGMGLLEGSRIAVDAWEGGDVIIEEVHQRSNRRGNV